MRTLKADLLRYPAANTTAVAYNNSIKPFDDKNVRLALLSGVRPRRLDPRRFKGVGQPYTRWIPPGVPGAQADKLGVPRPILRPRSRPWWTTAMRPKTAQR